MIPEIKKTKYVKIHEVPGVNLQIQNVEGGCHGMVAGHRGLSEH